MNAYLRTFAAALILTAAAPAVARAQTAPPASRLNVTAGLALTSQWDDETHLGTGPLISVGVSRQFADRFRWEGEVSVARHHRDSGYLKATGTPVVGTARLGYMFLSSNKKARPYVSLGLQLTHHRGQFVFTSLVPGPGGQPIAGPEERRDWRLTKAGWETGLGVEVRGDRRVWFRPEIRFGFTGLSTRNQYQPGRDTLEPPVWTIRGGLMIGF
jgi:opacity protein-like surface antigen